LDLRDLYPLPTGTEGPLSTSENIQINIAIHGSVSEIPKKTYTVAYGKIADTIKADTKGVVPLIIKQM
jgi:hypothetical protein